MSVTITITDPTDDEAHRVADYLMSLVRPMGTVDTIADHAGVPNVAAMKEIYRAEGFPVDTAPIFTPPPAPTAAFASTPVVPAAPTVIVVPVEAPRQHRRDDAPPAPHGVELDSAGLPWDGRIHSDTKSKIGDGTWRIRRGADPAVVATVTAELKAAMTAPGAGVALQQSKIPTFAGDLTTTQVVPAPAGVPIPPPFVLSAAPSVPPVPTTPATGSAGAAPTASPSSEVPVPPVSIAITTFPQLMMAITKGIAKGTFTQPDVVKAIEGVGLASIPMLASRPDLIPAVATALGV